MNKIGNPNLGTTDNYASKLKKMSEKEREAHLAERRKNKVIRMAELTRKQALEEVFDAQKAQWVAEGNNIMVSLAKEAKLGNVQAARLLFEYLFGKPETQVDITSNGNTLQAPTIIFKNRELDEWKNEDDTDDAEV